MSHEWLKSASLRIYIVTLELASAKLEEKEADALQQLYFFKIYCEQGPPFCCRDLPGV